MHRQILVCVCSFAAVAVVVVQRGSSVVLHNFTICSPLSPHLASLSFVFCFTTDAVGGYCFDFAWTHTHTYTNAHAHWFAGISVVCNTRICMAIMQLIELFHYAGGPVYGCVCVYVCVCLWQWHTPLYVSHVSFFNFFSRRKQNNSA